MQRFESRLIKPHYFPAIAFGGFEVTGLEIFEKQTPVSPQQPLRLLVSTILLRKQWR
jgi:hypothetical protein